MGNDEGFFGTDLPMPEAEAPAAGASEKCEHCGAWYSVEKGHQCQKGKGVDEVDGVDEEDRETTDTDESQTDADEAQPFKVTERLDLEGRGLQRAGQVGLVPRRVAKSFSEVIVTKGDGGLHSLGLIADWCKKFCNTNFFPPRYQGKPEEATLAIHYAQVRGIFDPFFALQNIAVINQIPAGFGDLPLAICRASGVMEDFLEEEIGTKPKPGSDLKDWPDDYGWRCSVKRKGQNRPIVREFVVAMARQAKLWMKRGKEGRDTPWMTYPSRMLMFRARGWALRDACGDVLGGMMQAEEAYDVVDAEYKIEPMVPDGSLKDKPEGAMEMETQETRETQGT